MMLPEGIHHGVPESVYRADPGINQSTLKAFGDARSPSHFQYENLNPTEEADYLRIGKFVDNYFLQNKDWDSCYAVWRERRQGKAWKEFQETNKGRIILSEKELFVGNQIISQLERHPDFVRLLTLCHHQSVVIARHPIFGCRMKALVDMLPKDECDISLLSFVFDLKTAHDASPDGFARQARLCGYDIQAAWYMDTLRFAGREVESFGFIAAENEPPFEVAIHYLPFDSREVVEARTRYELWLPAYVQCMESGLWPGYGDQWFRLTMFSKPVKPERETMV